MLTSRYDDPTATLLGAFVDSLLNSFLVLGSIVGGLSTKLGDGKLCIGKLWSANALLNLFVLLLIPPFGLCGQSDKGA
jgi:hypothetical protein